MSFNNFSSLSSLCFSFLLLFYSTNAFDITKILSQYPDFSTFSKYLTQTQVADAINSRQSITVLAVSNDNASPLAGQPVAMIKKVLSLHVVLDYYNVPKFQNMQNKSVILTTLFQASGQAVGQQGFLNVSKSATGGVVFGSAVPGSEPQANLVKSVASQPYNISVLQVSGIVMPTGNANNNSSSPTTHSPPTTAPSILPMPGTSPAGSPEKPPSGDGRGTPLPSPAKPPAAGPAPLVIQPNATSPSPTGGANSPSDSLPPDIASGLVGGPTTSPPTVLNGPTAVTPAADSPAADAPAGTGDASYAAAAFGAPSLTVAAMVLSLVLFLGMII